MGTTMFTNVGRYSVWDTMARHVHAEDEKTPQLEVDGERRGQTQRYLGVVGDVLKELFDKVEESFSWGQVSVTELALLEFLQRRFDARFIKIDVVNEPVIREMLDEIVSAWRLKATFSFLYWMIYKVFGWRLEQAITQASQVLITNSQNSFLYDDTLSEMENKVLYDPALFTPDDKTTLVIDVFADPDFLVKKESLERLARRWSYPAFYQYVNTPPPVLDATEVPITSVEIQQTGPPSNLGKLVYTMGDPNFIIINTDTRFQLMTTSSDFATATPVGIDHIDGGNIIHTAQNATLGAATSSLYRAFVARNGFFNVFDNVPVV